MDKNSLIRTTYLYLFTIVGLTLLSIGTVRLVDMVLKIFIFTKADADVSYEMKPPTGIYNPDKTITEEDFVSAIEKCQESCELGESQKKEMEAWLSDYKAWQENQKNMVSWHVQSRQRDASQSLAFILIGFPLYFYHWNIIRKEAKRS